MGAVMERPQAEQQRPNSSLIVLPIKATAANVLAVTPPATFPPQVRRYPLAPRLAPCACPRGRAKPEPKP